MKTNLKNRNKVFNQRSKVAVICFVLMFITIGFAALSATLSINANTTIGKIVYDVHFENVTEIEGSMEAKVPATVDVDDRTKLDFNLELTIPGQYYEFEVDVVNSGTLNALLSSIEVTGLDEAQRKYLSISYTYYDGTEIKLNDALPAGTSDRIKVRVDFLLDIELSDLPAQGTSNNFTLNLTYTQDPGTGVRRNKLYYFKLADRYVSIDNVASDNVTSPNGINFANDYTIGNNSGVMQLDLTQAIPNGQGIYLRAGTENDEYPIFYYRGNVTDNNVLFAGLCWKIVRTTETGGVKLVYSGIPDNGTCDSSKNTSSMYPSINYNTYGGSVSDVGYMYGDRHSVSDQSLGGDFSTNGVRVIYESGSYYYTTEEPVYDSSAQTYTLSGGSILSSAEIKEGLSSSKYYTCFSTSTSCKNNVSYVYAYKDYNSNTLDNISGSTSRMIIRKPVGLVSYISLNSGQSLENVDTTLSFSNTIKVNEDGTYSLEEPIYNIKYTEWVEHYSEYANRYFCESYELGAEGTDTCTIMSRVSQVFDSGFTYYYVYNYVFGNDVEYNETTGEYTLKDIYEVTYDDNINKKLESELSKRHYTCFTNSDSCKSVSYLVSIDESMRILSKLGKYSNNFEQDYHTIQYVKLSGGKKIENVISDMNANVNDSLIKTTVDTWYENNLGYYTDLLETDAVWCNNRTMLTGGYLGKDVDISNRYGVVFERNKGLYNPGLDFSTGTNNFDIMVTPAIKDEEACPNINDRFTVSTSNVGNKALKYPVGLLTADELLLAGYGSDGTNLYGSVVYLDNTLQNWTMTPLRFPSYMAVWSSYISPYITSYNRQNILVQSRSIISNGGYARPSVSLKSSVVFSGDGTAENPYVVESMMRDFDLSGDMM